MKFDIRNLVIALMTIAVIWLALRGCRSTDTTIEQIQSEYTAKDSTLQVQHQKLLTEMQQAVTYMRYIDSAAVKQDQNIKQIPIRYEVLRNNVRKLDADSQLLFFSGWLSEIGNNR